MIERDFDVPFVAQLAQREKQIQQHYRPIIGVHKWFARRPGSLFRALTLAEFDSEQLLPVSYFQSHDLGPLIVGDPFMGGGTPLLEANRVGCHVIGADVNPMAYWIVRQELAELDRKAFRSAAKRVVQAVEAAIGDLYKTTCISCGNQQASVKYFLWVKRQLCAKCRRSVDLFSRYLVAKNQRHPNYVLVCPECGSLNEVEQLNRTSAGMRCTTCQTPVTAEGPARRNRCPCPHCGHVNSYPNWKNQPPTHRLFAIEYHCPTCKPTHQGRFFKAPDERDLRRVEEAKKRLQKSRQNCIPDDPIPPGDETDRLHRWGYQTYRQLFNDRQLLGLQTLAAEIAAVEDESVRHALLTVFSDTLRYQNMVCRYDSYSLKIIDIFSVHGFPVSTIQCENSLLGIPGVGSGGFRHFVKKYDQAKAYCEKPFETYPGRPKRTVSLPNETIGATLVSNFPDGEAPKSAYLAAVSADELALPAGSLDAVLTDPPYFANVQYAELMDFCYVWLKKHLADSILAFRPASTRSAKELTVNETEGRDIAHFTIVVHRSNRNKTVQQSPSAGDADGAGGGSKSMQLINRCAVVIKPKQPFIDWINQVVSRAEREFTLDEVRMEECTVLLVPDLFGPADVLEYVAPMKPTLFEMELEGWYTDPERWPEDRTNEMFDEWFDLEIHSMVWDAASTAIVGEEERELIPPDIEEYPSPVGQLLTYGKAKRTEWPDYVGEFDLGLEHVPVLIQMATDERLNEAHPESLEVWAPVHAWRALGQLEVEEAIEPLMRLFHEQEEDDYVREELPEVYGMIGPAAIPALATYLQETSYGLFPRGTAVFSLEQIGERHPEARDECVAILARELERFKRNHPGLNGFLVSALLTLNAEESASVMQRAFAAGAVDETLVNWNDVQQELGIEAEPKRRKKRRRRRRRK